MSKLILEEAMREKIENLINQACLFQKYFSCPTCRKAYHVSFALEYDEIKNKLFLVKTGQYPSIFLLNTEVNKALDKVLDKLNIRDDYYNAEKSRLNGDNVAAFLYLRRVLEKYVMIKFQESEKSIGVCMDDFAKKKTSEKIDLLKEHISNSLVQNKKVYSLLSEGVHELLEKTCYERFPIMKSVVDVILQEEMLHKEEEKTLKQMQEVLRKR